MRVQQARVDQGDQFKRDLEEWLQVEQGQGDLMVKEVLNCLDEAHLVSLPLPKGVHWPARPAARNFRFLFRRQVAHLLGWTDRRVEGEAVGFSFAVNRGLRSCWWPDEESQEERRSLSPHLHRQTRYVLTISFLICSLPFCLSP